MINQGRIMDEFGGQTTPTYFSENQYGHDSQIYPKQVMTQNIRKKGTPPPKKIMDTSL